MNTILSRDSYPISLIKLQQLPPPKSGKKFHPINHYDFIDAFLSGIMMQNPESEQTIETNDDGEVMVSAMCDMEHTIDVSVIGINTYAANKPISLLFGAGITNGRDMLHFPHMEITKKKNESTPEFLAGMPKILSETITRVDELNRNRSNAYCSEEVSKKDFIYFVAELIVEEMIPAHCLQEIVLEWHRISIEERKRCSINAAARAILLRMPIAVIESHKTRSMIIFDKLDKWAKFKPADCLNQMLLPV